MTEPVDLNAERAKRKHKPKAAPREGWESQLLLDQHGRVKGNLSNVMLILTGHPRWVGVIAFDAFKQSVVTQTPAPTRETETPVNHAAGEWTDEDSVRTAAWISQTYGNNVEVKTVDNAVAGIAARTIVHPVRDYLQSLTWDAQKRLPSMFSVYFGSEQNDYTSAIGVRFMVSAVARVFEPGCKVDNVVTWEGGQGIGKSSAARILAVRSNWYSDTGVTLGDKDSYQCLRGTWIYELAELASIRSARDVERYKAFFSSPVDKYRPSYGKRTAGFPRQTVFIGTTNELEYLNDRSGNRRFWPIRCGRIDLVSLQRDVDLLWAEAVARYESREVWHVDSIELAERCKDEQAEREQVDPWVQFGTEWLSEQYPLIRNGIDDYDRVDPGNGITTAEFLRGAIGMAKDRIDRAVETRAGQVLRHLGLERRRVRQRGKLSWRYFEVPTSVGTNEEGGNP